MEDHGKRPAGLPNFAAYFHFPESMLFLAGFFLSLLGSLPPGLISLTAAQTAIRRGLAAALILSAGAAIAEFFQAWLAAEAAGWFLQHPAVEQGLRWAAVPVFLGLGGWLVFKPEAGAPVNPTPAPSPKGEGRSDIRHDSMSHLHATLEGSGVGLTEEEERSDKRHDSASRLPAPLGEGSGVGLTEKEGPTVGLTRFFSQGIVVSLFNLLAIPYWLAYCAWLRTTEWWQESRFSTVVFSSGVTLGTFAALAAYAALGHFAVHRSRSVGRWANKVVGATFIGLGLKVLIGMVFG